MVGWRPASLGRLEHERQLVAHPLLAGELGQPAGAQRRLDGAVVGVAAGVDDPGGGVERAVLVDLGGEAVGAGHQRGPARAARHGASRRRRGRRRRVSADPGDGVLGLLDRPAEPDQRLAHLVAPGRSREPTAGAVVAAAPTAGQGADLVAQLEDDPLGALLADAGHLGQGGDVAAADRGPQPVRGQHREHRQGEPRARRRRRSAPARRCRARRRTRSRRGSASPRGRPAWWPARPPGRGAGRTRWRASCAAACRLPRPRPRPGRARCCGPVRAPRRSRATPARWAASRARSRGGVRASRLVPPPCHRSQMARARASAASAGLGADSIRRMRCTMAVTWAFSARPEPVTAALTEVGVCSVTGRPRRAAASMGIAEACMVCMTLATLTSAKTCSTAIASGSNRSSQVSSSAWR